MPLPGVRRALALFGAVTLAVAWLFPGELHQVASGTHRCTGCWAWRPTDCFGAAVLHATMLDSAERQMRLRASGTPGPGLPLLRLERLTFRFVEAGFAVLTLAVMLGLATAPQWRLNHKTVFALMGWAVFAALLVGRHWRGWRGRKATRWLYAGQCCCCWPMWGRASCSR